MMNRRDVLSLAAGAGVASALFKPAVGADESSSDFRIVDSNVSLFEWPFRRLPLHSVEVLVRKLRQLGIEQAWAGSFEGILHRDVSAVNRRLTESCGQWQELIPIGSVNPELPGWEEDLRQCHEVHGMPGIRLHPGYHGYTLDDSRFIHLLKLATAAGLFVQIAASVEDVRTQHAKLRVPDVDLAPLPGVISQTPGVRLQILNCRPGGQAFEELAKIPDVVFDTARVDSTDGVPQLVKLLSPERVLLGTHAPFLIPEAALIRVHESGMLSEAELRAVFAGSAERFAKKEHS